ncbi:replication factor A protein 1-like isoform X1 [Lates japonicus]
MVKISMEEWKTALTSILEKLDQEQYKKLQKILNKLPQSKLTAKYKENMPKKIIEYYGVEESISAIKDAVDQIPRNDPAVQDLLRPFVDKLKKKQEKNKGKKRKHESDSESKDKKQKPAAAQQSSSKPEERKSQLWRKTIADLKTSGDLEQKAVTGKVVQKTGLISYQTKEKKDKFLFYLVVADETGSIRVMVYGKEHYEKIMENKSYMFRDVMFEWSDHFKEKVLKVTQQSKVSETSPINVPEEVELEAQKLISGQNPVSIKQAKRSEDKTIVTVEGTITKIGPVEPVKLKAKRGTKDRQDIKLKDDTDEISISLWGEDIKQLRGKSEGDVVKVTDVKTNHFRDTVSLNSTDFTRIVKVQSAPVQNVGIEIIGITTANKMETYLETECNSEVQTFVVASELLAEAFGVRLDSDFKKTLLEKIPLSAKAEIQGNKINKIKAA